MDIKLKNAENRVLYTVSEIMCDDDLGEGIYLSTLTRFGHEYSMIAIIKDRMGECIGIGKSNSGESYVFSDIDESIEFEEEFYKSGSSIVIDP